jgi:hypothetical protein
MSDVVSYIDSNKKKREKVAKMDPETKKQALDAKEKFEKFRKLCDTQEWKDCRDFIKDEIYQGLSLSPGEPGVGDWWLKYSWGLKCFIERAESHAKKYDDAIKFLSEQD